MTFPVLGLGLFQLKSSIPTGQKVRLRSYERHLPVVFQC